MNYINSLSLSKKYLIFGGLTFLCLLSFTFINTQKAEAGGGGGLCDINPDFPSPFGGGSAPGALSVYFIDQNGNRASQVSFRLRTVSGDGQGIYNGDPSFPGTQNLVDTNTCGGGENENFTRFYWRTCGGPGNSCNGTFKGNGHALDCTDPWGSSYQFVVEHISGLGGPGRWEWAELFSNTWYSSGTPFTINPNGTNNIKIFRWVPDPPPATPTSTPTATPACSGTTSIVNISWSGSTTIGGYWVDISTSSGFASFSNKWVTTTNTQGPSGFSPGMSFSPGTTYYTRVFNGATSGVRSFVAQNCATPPPSQPTGLSVSCNGTTPTFYWSGAPGNAAPWTGGFWINLKAGTSNFIEAPGDYSQKFHSAGSGNHNTPLNSGFSPGITLTSGQSYRVRVTNGSSPTPQGITFTAPSCVSPPSVDLRVNGSNSPPNIAVGGTITVSWTSSNATACYRNGGEWGTDGSTNIGTSNTGQVQPASHSSTPGPKTYQIRCTGSGSPATDQVTITVVVPPSVNIGATPNPAEVDDIIRINWTSSNATACYRNGGEWGTDGSTNIGTSNTGQVQPASHSSTPGPKTYRIRCTGPGGEGSHLVTVPVGYKPYLRVFGGDVLAGSGFIGGSCPNIDTTIQTYNNGSGGPRAWGGAGTQFAALAYGSIVDFSSAQQRSSGQPKSLSFANSLAGTYGGNFGNPICNSIDYFRSDIEATPISSGTAGGSSVIPGTPSSHYDTIPNGERIVLQYTGNLRITGNIKYNRTDWTKPGDIPSLYILVTGNIYIDNDVSILDGVYIARPDGTPNSGTIYTCTNGGSLYTISQLYGNCGNTKLTVNGAFLAERVKFLRTVGSRKDAASPANEAADAPHIAETFTYGPELWLVNPRLYPTSGFKYDSITSLPPVL